MQILFNPIQTTKKPNIHFAQNQKLCINSVASPIINFKADNFTPQIEKGRDLFYKNVPSIEKEKFYEQHLNKIWNQKFKGFAPPSILVSCFDEFMLKKFKEGIKNSSEYMGVNCSEIKADTDKNLFLRRVKEQMNCNRAYYKTTGKTSLIFIDNVEKVLGMNYEDTKFRSQLEFDEEEEDILKENSNAIIINKFKSILDHCHRLPESDEQGSATTFIFTTTKPTIFHPDFRDGKTAKFHLKSDKQSYPQLLKEMLNDTKKSLINEINYTDLATKIFPNSSKGQIINDLNKIELPQDKLSAGILSLLSAPNQFIGGYSTEKLFSVMKKSCIKQIETNGTTPFSLTFTEILYKTPRDISASKIKKQDNFITQNDKYSSLMALENDGMLTDSAKAELEALICKEKQLGQQLTAKKEKKLLTPDEERTLRQLKVRYEDFEYEDTTFIPKIKTIPHGGKEVEYQPNKFTKIFNGDLGYNKEVLWIDTPDIYAVNSIKRNINLIKAFEQFKDVKKLQVAHFDGIELEKDLYPTRKYTGDKKQIYELDLSKANNS